MCWNWQVSLVTWAVGLATAIYLLRRRNKYDATFAFLILAYSSMQLWEFFMWRDQNCGSQNRWATKAAYYALWSHTLAIGIGLYYEFGVWMPMVVGAILMGVAIFRAHTIDWKCSRPSGDGCRHLVWGFPHVYYVGVFLVCILFCFMYIKPRRKAAIIAALFGGSFLFSLGAAKRAAGSYWCFLAAAFCWILIYLNRDSPSSPKRTRP